MLFAMTLFCPLTKNTMHILKGARKQWLGEEKVAGGFKKRLCGGAKPLGS